MRNANSQLPSSMIPVCALHQLPSPHVSHAETEGETRPSMLRSFGDASRVKASAKAGQDGQRCALLTTKSRNTCTRATVFNSSG